MPLTFPSHAAAILPLTHPRLRVLPPVALVVGAGAPDLGYLLRMGGSHVWSGLWKVTLLGVVAWLWVELLLLPLLRRTLPRQRPAIPARLVTRGLPRTPGGWCAGALALLLGATTHLLWDGLTKDGLWPASVLYAGVEVFGGLTLARLGQHLSTVVGGAAAVWVWWRRAPRDAAALPAPADRWWRRVMVLAVVAAMGLQALRELRWMHPSTTLEVFLWNGFWASARGAAGALTLLALTDRVVERATRGERMPSRRVGRRPEADASP